MGGYCCRKEVEKVGYRGEFNIYLYVSMNILY